MTYNHYLDNPNVPRPHRFSLSEFGIALKKRIESNPALRSHLKSVEPMMLKSSQTQGIDQYLDYVIDKLNAHKADQWILSTLQADLTTLLEPPTMFQIEKEGVDELRAPWPGKLASRSVTSVNRPPGTLMHFQLDGIYPGNSPTGHAPNAFYAYFGQSPFLTVDTQDREDGVYSRLSNFIEISFLRRPKKQNLLDEAAGYFICNWQTGTDPSLHEAIEQTQRNTAEMTASGLAELMGVTVSQARQASLVHIKSSMREQLPDIIVALEALARPDIWKVVADPNGMQTHSSSLDEPICVKVDYL